MCYLFRRRTPFTIPQALFYLLSSYFFPKFRWILSWFNTRNFYDPVHLIVSPSKYLNLLTELYRVKEIHNENNIFWEKKTKCTKEIFKWSRKNVDDMLLARYRSRVNYATKQKTLTLLLACTSRLSDRIKSHFHHHQHHHPQQPIEQAAVVALRLCVCTMYVHEQTNDRFACFLCILLSVLPVPKHNEQRCTHTYAIRCLKLVFRNDRILTPFGAFCMRTVSSFRLSFSQTLRTKVCSTLLFYHFFFLSLALFCCHSACIIVVLNMCTYLILTKLFCLFTVQRSWLKLS